MTRLVGGQTLSPWAWVVSRPPTSKILGYLLQKWTEYEKKFTGLGEPFSCRTEPELTEGLAAFLDQEEQAGRQPFDGEFFGELHRYDLLPDGKRSIVGRSDIEWRLFGTPAFVVEFKVIGNGRPAIAYVTHGMARFVDGRYAARATEGAMWALIRPGSTESVEHIEALIDRHIIPLRCESECGVHRISPSTLAPGTANFDSVHRRDPAHAVIRLAHIIVDIVPARTRRRALQLKAKLPTRKSRKVSKSKKRPPKRHSCRSS